MRESTVIRALIVDDEPLARDAIRLALAQDPEITVVGQAADGEQAVSAIESLRPDLVFLDVQMPGLDGFDVVNAIGADAMPPIVFVTAFDTHAVRAFEVNAVDYILKPFDDRRVAEALLRAKARLRAGDLQSAEARLLQLLRDVRGHGASVQRFMVRRGDRTHIVRPHEVDWFEGDGNYVRLHVRDETFKLRTTIQTLCKQLDASEFVRIHRSTVVNLGRIKEIQAWFGGDYVAILHDGRQLRVSRTYAQDLLRPVQ